jgi:hypothetical protein
LKPNEGINRNNSRAKFLFGLWQIGGEGMSFASETKKELTNLEVKSCCSKAELSALIRMNGSLSFSSRKLVVDIQTENAAIALCIEDNNEIIASAFGYKRKNTLILQELLTKEGFSVRETASAFCRYCGAAEGVVSMPFDGVEGVPFACVRVFRAIAN